MSATKELSVSERVCLAKAEIAAIPKNGWNPHGKYNHATVDDVYNALRPVLAKHKLDLKLDIKSAEVRAGSNDKPWVFIEAAIGFEGEEPCGRHIAVPMTGPQTYEIVSSYIQKQYLRARFQIETGEYDEQELTKENPPANPPAKAPVSANITDEQRMDLEAVIEETGIDKKEFCDWLGVGSLSDIRVADHERALAGIRKKREQIAAGQDQQRAA